MQLLLHDGEYLYEEPLRCELNLGVHLLAVCLNVYYLRGLSVLGHTHNFWMLGEFLGFCSVLTDLTRPPKLIYGILFDI